MIRDGLILLINNDPNVAAMLPAGGGWVGSLPKGQLLPSWSYTWISDDGSPGRGLQMPAGGLTFALMQIDVHAATGDEMVALGQRISKVLAGFRGPLPDTEATIVDSIFDEGGHDVTDDPVARNKWGILEFRVNYVKQV